MEDEILPTCRELGIGFVPYSPLGRGFLSGRFTSPDELDEGDFRRSGPRFTGENLDANLKLAAKVTELANEKGITPAQLAIAWVLANGDDLVPIPGTKRRTYLEQNAAAVDITLAPEEIVRIEAELPRAAGDRYNEAGMATPTDGRPGDGRLVPDQPTEHRAQPGSVASIAATSSADSGSTWGRKRATRCPPGATRNFSKFHFTSPASPPASAMSVSV